jgi:hypothetical protein
MKTPKKKKDYGGYDSTLELYFSFWLDELKEAGYVLDYHYEPETIEITSKKEYYFLKNNKYNPKIYINDLKYTPDFLIKWDLKAHNIFYQNFIKYIIFTNCNIHDMPNNVMHTIDYKQLTAPLIAQNCYTYAISSVEIKPEFDLGGKEARFKIIQKVLLEYKNIYINLINPFDYRIKTDKATKKKTRIENGFFFRTWTPKKVIELEVFKRDCKRGKKGESMLKYQVRTLEEFLSTKK